MNWIQLTGALNLLSFFLNVFFNVKKRSTNFTDGSPDEDTFYSHIPATGFDVCFAFSDKILVIFVLLQMYF